jgi:hypothetical protein
MHPAGVIDALHFYMKAQRATVEVNIVLVDGI